MPIIEIILEAIKSIPNIVWSGLLASLITLAGVFLSNHGNTKRLKEQLEHDAKEKSKDRITSLRREVYLKYVEDIAFAFGNLSKLQSIDPTKENAGDLLTNYLSSSAKIGLIAPPETSKLASDLTSILVDLFNKLLIKSTAIHDLNLEIKLLTEAYEGEVLESKRLLSEIKAMTESGKIDQIRFQVLNSALNSSNDEAKKYAAERDTAYKNRNLLNKEYGLYLIREMEAIPPVQIKLSASLRSEIGLETDIEGANRQYAIAIEKMKSGLIQLQDHLEKSN